MAVAELASAGAVLFDFGRGQRVDDLAATRFRRRCGRRMDSIPAGTPGGRRKSHLVLPRQTALAPAPDFYLSTVDDRCHPRGGIFANRGRSWHTGGLLAHP